MDAGNALIEKVGALLGGIVQADLAECLTGVASALQSLEKTPRKTGAACEFGHSAHRGLAGHGHDAGNNRHIDARQSAPFTKVVEVVIIKEKLSADVIRSCVYFRFEVVHLQQAIWRGRVAFWKTSHTDAETA